MGGGAARSPLVRQMITDTTGLKVALPQTPELVLPGAAMLGAVAAGTYASLGQTMASMSTLGRLAEPATQATREFHRKKREVYGLLRGLDRAGREAMRSFDLKCS